MRQYCSTHPDGEMEIIEWGYEPGRLLGDWYQCTHSGGNADRCTVTRLIESQSLIEFHKTGKWPA